MYTAQWYENAIKYYQKLMRNTLKTSERAKYLAKIIEFKKCLKEIECQQNEA